MKRYYAQLLIDITEDVKFESIDAQTGVKFTEYTVPHTYTAGTRQFRRLRDAQRWVNDITTQYGTHAARLGAA